MEISLYNSKGESKGTQMVPDASWSVPVNSDLLHQVVVAYMANARSSIAHTKDRADVRGGGKKPWRQKGTGRARHGSIRSPIWKGGGVTFGPRSNRNYSQKINKKMSDKALAMVLSTRLADKSVIAIESFDFALGKTKDSVKSLAPITSAFTGYRLSKTKRDPLLLVVGKDFSKVSLSLRNVPGITIIRKQDLNVVDAISHPFIVFDAAVFNESANK